MTVRWGANSPPATLFICVDPYARGTFWFDSTAPSCCRAGYDTVSVDESTVKGPYALTGPAGGVVRPGGRGGVGNRHAACSNSGRASITIDVCVSTIEATKLTFCTHEVLATGAGVPPIWNTFVKPESPDVPYSLPRYRPTPRASA